MVTNRLADLGSTTLISKKLKDLEIYTSNKIKKRKIVPLKTKKKVFCLPSSPNKCQLGGREILFFLVFQFVLTTSTEYIYRMFRGEQNLFSKKHEKSSSVPF